VGTAQDLKLKYMESNMVYSGISPWAINNLWITFSKSYNEFWSSALILTLQLKKKNKIIIPIVSPVNWSTVSHVTSNSFYQLTSSPARASTVLQSSLRLWLTLLSEYFSVTNSLAFPFLTGHLHGLLAAVLTCD